MFIEQVSIYNVDTLFDIVSDIFENENFSNKMFERRLISLYSNISINMMIKHISFIEYYHLKSILQENSVSKFREIRSNIIEHVGSTYPELTSSVRMMKRTINEDDFIHLLPAGCIPFSCEIKISGRDLSMIFEMDPMRKFFLELVPQDKLQHRDHTFNREEVKNMFKDGVVTDINIENFINTKFMENFYKNLIVNHDYIDLLSDFSIQKYFYSESPIKLISIDDVTSPLKDNFNMNSMIETVKDNHTILLDEVTLTFAMKSRFYTFLNMYNTLPKNMFTNIETFRIPHSDIANYHLSNEPNMLKIVEIINDTYNIKGKEIVYATLIPNNAQIHYIIKGTLSQFNHLSSILNTIKDENCKDIINKILSYSNSVYKSLNA